APVPLQLAYQAWVTNTRTVLQQQEQPQLPSTESAAERSNVLQRALNMLRFLWLLCQALVDGLTQWLDSRTQEHTDMSNVLRLERCVMAQRLAKGQEINHEFPDELYELPPEEFPQELSPPASLAAGSQSGASRQVHRYPRGGVGGQGAHPCPCVIPSGCLRATPSSGSQELVTNLGSQEDVADAQQFLALPLQRRRTASELLKSRWAWGQWDR
ncbi:PIEZ1 protein, partial [Picathartes gymnocephalus]|nr:PIEZ1 protein [Picathartes gymnocephalus]